MTYDGVRLMVGKTSDEELDRDHRGRRPPRARSMPASKSLRDKYADLIREKFPDIPRRVSGYNLP